MLAALWAFFPFEDVVAAPFRLAGTERARATVTAVSETRGAVDKGANTRRVYRFDYQFTDHTGRQRVGASYSTDRLVKPGERAAVVYPRRAPQFSQLDGMSRSLFGWPTVVVIVFPATAVAMLVSGYRRVLRSRRPAAGVMATCAPASTSRGRDRVGKRRLSHHGASDRGAADDRGRELGALAANLRALTGGRVGATSPVPTRSRPTTLGDRDANDVHTGGAERSPRDRLLDVAIAVGVPTLILGGHLAYAVWRYA